MQVVWEDKVVDFANKWAVYINLGLVLLTASEFTHGVHSLLTHHSGWHRGYGNPGKSDLCGSFVLVQSTPLRLTS